MGSIFDLGYELVNEALIAKDYNPIKPGKSAKEEEIIDLNKDKIHSCDIHDRAVDRKGLLKGKSSLIEIINRKSKGVVLFEPKRNLFIGAIIINDKDVYVYTEPKYKCPPIDDLMVVEANKLMRKIDEDAKDSILTKIKKCIGKPRGII